MDVVKLIRELKANGIELHLDNEKLIVKCQRSQLPPDRQRQIKDAKASIVQFLKSSDGNVVKNEQESTESRAFVTVTATNIGNPAGQVSNSAVNEELADIWDKTLNRIEGDPSFPPDLVENMRSAVVRQSDPYEDWSDDELEVLWLERAAKIRLESGVSDDESKDSAFAWLKTEVGPRRLSKVVAGGHSSKESTPKPREITVNNGPELSRTNGKVIE